MSFTKREWKLTDQEIAECRNRGISIDGAQTAKKQAYLKAGGIILNPDALPDLYEALRKWQDGGFNSQIEFANAVRKALAKAEGK